jgi:hypothetical protein
MEFLVFQDEEHVKQNKLVSCHYLLTEFIYLNVTEQSDIHFSAKVPLNVSSFAKYSLSAAEMLVVSDNYTRRYDLVVIQ